MDAQTFLTEFGHIANASREVARLRELVLQLALSGRLVEQRTDESDVQSALVELGSRRHSLLDEKGLSSTRKHRNLEAPKGWFPVPNSWRWELLGYLSLWPLKDGDWIESKDQDLNGDIRIVQLADIGVGIYKDRSHRFLNSTKAADLGCYFLEQNDILIARLPDPLGRACMFPGDAKPSVTVVDVAVCRCDPELINPRFLMNCINAPAVSNLIRSWAVGTTRQRVATGRLGAIPLPIPPIEEQSRIVAKIDELMALCDQLGAQQQGRRKLQNSLRQATLQALASAQSPRELQNSWQRLSTASSATPRVLTSAISSKRCGSRSRSATTMAARLASLSFLRASFPDYQTLMLPVLRLAATGETRVADVSERIADNLGLSQAERDELLPSGRQRLLHNRIHWAKFYMSKAGLIASPARGRFVATDKGKALLATSPERIDMALLMQEPEFREFFRNEGAAAGEKRGELRWSDREGGWEVFIPAAAFKNAHSSFFGDKPFRLVLPDLLDLYKYIDAYVDRHRSVLLRSAADPGTFFVKTVKTTSTDAAYDTTSFYEAWRLTIQRYGIYNPYTGRGAIKGLLPHGPHNVRDVLATHILKQTGSYEQASYAIQDTADMVAKHYGRFLPQDKAALAARILNQVWEAA